MCGFEEKENSQELVVQTNIRFSISQCFCALQSKLLKTTPSPLLLLGPSFYILIQLLLFLSGLRFDYWRNEPWQLIPETVLSDQPFESIWFLHIQPPGFNLTAMLLDRFGTASGPIWHISILVGTSITIWMLSSIVWHWTEQITPAVFAGITYGLLPSTHLYSLWLFYTQPVAIFLTFMAWGLVRGRATGKSRYLIFSMLSVTSLFFWRSSVLWFMAIAWIVALLCSSVKDSSKILQKSRNKLLVTGTVLILVISVFTIKNLVLFGSISQSSWAPENMAKVFFYSASEKVLGEIGSKNPCFKELVKIEVFKDISKYPECTKSVASKPKIGSKISVLNRLNWLDGTPNFNSGKRLALQEKWRDFDLEVVASDPKILLRVLWPSISSERRGSIVQFLWMATDYKFLKQNNAKLGIIGTIWAVIFAWVPALCLVFWFYFLYFRRTPVKLKFRNSFSQLAITIFMLCLMLEYLFLEIGENQRYRVEIEPLIVVMGVVGCWQFMNRKLPSHHCDN